MTTLFAKAAVLCTLSLCAGQDFGREPTLETVRHLFDRPENTTIGQEQRDRLKALLADRSIEDLGEFGYLVALDRYLSRDLRGATEMLDQFLERHPSIAIEEHRSMLGRVYLNAVATEARKESPDAATLGRWAERMVTLYPDDGLLLRVVSTVLPRLPDQGSFRVAFARGALSSGRTPSATDALLRGLYATTSEAAATKSPVDAATTRGTARAVDIGVGTAAPALRVTRTLDGRPFALADHRGKVVLLDFFATWCGPCRAALPRVRALAKEHAGELQLVGVTRFYGRGMDFGDPTSELPHGGAMKNGIDEPTELSINTEFAERFEIDYPVVFTTPECMASDYAVRGIPTVIVIGKDGSIVGRVVGANETAERSLRELIARALAD